MSFRIFFAPSGKQGVAAEGETILSAARALGVDLDSVCGGRGICGRCQIGVEAGEFAKQRIQSSLSHVGAITAAEERYAGRRSLASGRRLGCQARICGDLVIDVPADSQLHKQVLRKAVSDRAFVVDPTIRAYYVEVAEPDIENPASDLTRLLAALNSQWGLSAIEVPLAALPGLQKTLRAGGWKVTAAVRDGKELTALYPAKRRDPQLLAPALSPCAGG